jgi:ureidomalonase
MQSSTNPTEMSDKQDLPAEEDKRGLSRRRILTTAVAGGAVIAGGGLTNVANAKPRPPRNELVEVEALELSKLIKNRSVSCVEVMETFLAHIHRYNPRVNAIINLIDDGILLQQAAERDRQLRRGQYLGWMHGFPHAVKESTQVKGLPWTQGSPVHRDRVGTTDSRSVAQMRAAGALIIGNTNLPEFALGSNSYNPIYGRTGSAFAPSRTSGGSSGGAASALGLRMVPVPAQLWPDLLGGIHRPSRCFGPDGPQRPGPDCPPADVGGSDRPEPDGADR